MEQHEADRGATGDAPEAPNHTPDEAEDLAARVQELEERAQRYLANWQRAQADLQNFRRQVERDQEEMAQWATAALVQQTLSVLDDFERAFGSIPANLLSMTWIEGIWLVYKKLEATLAARGLEAMEVQPGQPFDPNLHQAITEVDGEAGKVVDAVQKGYTLAGRVLRPVLVTVGNGSVSTGAADDATPEGTDSANGESAGEKEEPPDDEAPASPGA